MEGLAGAPGQRDEASAKMTLGGMGQFASSSVRPETSVTVRVTTARAQPRTRIREAVVEAGRGGGKPGR